MKDVINTIKQLEITPSIDDKLNILKLNKDNTLFYKVLKYTYDGKFKYDITRDTIEQYISEQPTTYTNGFYLLDMLSSTNINESSIIEIVKFLNSKHDDEKEIWIRILTKDLRCGIDNEILKQVLN